MITLTPRNIGLNRFKWKRRLSGSSRAPSAFEMSFDRFLESFRGFARDSAGVPEGSMATPLAKANPIDLRTNPITHDQENLSTTAIYFGSVSFPIPGDTL